MKRPTNNSKHNFRYSPDNSDGLGNRNSRFGYQHGSNSRLRGNTFDSIPDISSKTAVPGFPETFNISRLSRSATMPHGNGSNEPALPPGVSKDPTRKIGKTGVNIIMSPIDKSREIRRRGSLAGQESRVYSGSAATANATIYNNVFIDMSTGAVAVPFSAQSSTAPSPKVLSPKTTAPTSSPVNSSSGISGGGGGNGDNISDGKSSISGCGNVRRERPHQDPRGRSSSDGDKRRGAGSPGSPKGKGNNSKDCFVFKKMLQRRVSLHF